MEFSKPKKPCLDTEGRYILRIERALNLYRLGNVLFVIEGAIERGPAPEYEGKSFSHVCPLPTWGAWNAHAIATATSNLTGDAAEQGAKVAGTAQRAYDRSWEMRRLRANDEPDESVERDKDETILIAPAVAIAVDVSIKLMRLRKKDTEQHSVLYYKFTKAEK